MENSFQIVLLPQTEKDLRKLPWNLEKKILEGLQLLKNFPFVGSKVIKKMKTLKPVHYELKEGDYRIIFRVEDKRIIVKMIIDRKNLEKEIKRL
ncbi:MAG: type II toxin-antitoxin system RelE/ParE family toxin [Armatimonadetes bacterium]|nr:type II toxin-antitoxin system RelE/ParE family toxin [Armatimonadota bacterium]